MLTKSCPVAAVDVVQVIAVFCQELGVGGVECQSVATGLEFRDSAVAFPVLVARMMVGVESVVIRALEVLLSQYCKKTQVCIVRVPGRLCCMSSNWGGGGGYIVTTARHALQMQRVAAVRLALTS